MLNGPVVVTGASGMMGRHLLRLLGENSVAYIATSRRALATLPAGSKWVEWDFARWQSPEDLDRLFPDAAAVIHAGALVPATIAAEVSAAMFDANVRATVCLAHWAFRKGLPLLYLSSSTVYRHPDRSGIVETDPLLARGVGGFGFYGLSKLLGEEAMHHLAEPDARLCILRPSSVYGHGLPPGKLIPKLLAQAAAGRVIEIGRPEDDRVDLIHAEDVARAALQALAREAWGVFNVASERPVTMVEIAEACVAAAGVAEIRIVGDAATRPAQLRFGLSCKAARERFGFAPQYDLAAGIRRMWEDMTSDG
jgi:UDP-glucose 4-epimerase